jgi:putative aminopeptidase FrvX
MKKFVDVCKMTQKEVKTYMEEYLTSREYKVENKDGFLYAKGDVPVLLVAHMDTVHKQLPITTVSVNGKISSPQGIGGDDRCGIFIIMNIIKDLRCSVLLCEDEEIGGVGARKFTYSPFIKELDVNYMIEFDRANANDAVFYSCDNKEFTKFVTGGTGFKEAHGTFSDISVLAPAAKIAAVNLSCGYYKAHTTDEYVVYDEMMNTIEMAEALIETECDQFEYVEKKIYYSRDYGWDYGDQMSYRTTSSRNRNRFATRNLEVELTVMFIRDYEGEEEVGYGTGTTKAEAWLDFFENYDDVCYGQIIDYSFC